MSKHRKRAAPSSNQAAASNPLQAAHPPTRRPALLTVSILLFALWFLFLLVTALTSGSL